MTEAEILYNRIRPAPVLVGFRTANTVSSERNLLRLNLSQQSTQPPAASYLIPPAQCCSNRNSPARFQSGRLARTGSHRRDGVFPEAEL